MVNNLTTLTDLSLIPLLAVYLLGRAEIIIRIPPRPKPRARRRSKRRR